MGNVSTVYLTIDRSDEENANNGTMTIFTSLPEAMGYMAEKSNCELYVISEVVRLL